MIRVLIAEDHAMVRAGLTPMEALVAATSGSAAMLGSNDRGTLQAGKRADLIVLAANPLENIANTRHATDRRKSLGMGSYLN